MKSRKHFTLVAILVVMAVFGLWWLLRPKTAATEKTTEASMPAKLDAPKQVTPLTQVELPKVPAAPAGDRANPSALLVSDDPQADLKTAISNIANLYRLGDVYTLVKNYTPPDKSLPPEQLQLLQEKMAQLTPDFREKHQTVLDEGAKVFESLENLTPTYNSTGDEATYTYSVQPQSDGDATQVTKTFIKINGKWYLK